MNRKPASQSRWVGALVALLLALSFFRAIGQEQSSTVASAKEQEVKSAFLFNFLKYVEWPASSHADTNASLVVGISGDDPIASHLLKIAQGRTIDGKRLDVKMLTDCKEARDVHVLWVGSFQGKQQEHWLQAASGKNVLTIGETEIFSRRSGIITFVIESDKVRFDINMKAARRNGIMIRAQLQTLARKLHRADE